MGDDTGDGIIEDVQNDRIEERKDDTASVKEESEKENEDNKEEKDDKSVAVKFENEDSTRDFKKPNENEGNNQVRFTLLKIQTRREKICNFCCYFY